MRCDSEKCHPVLPCLRNRALAKDVPRFDKVSWYSATRCNATKLILSIIGEHSSTPKTVWDAFGGSGADAIAFLLHGFAKVAVTELDPTRARSARQRIVAYARDAEIPVSRLTLTVGDSTAEKNMHDADIVYADPPWGGPLYKNQDVIKIKLNDKALGAYIADFRKHSHQLLVLKLPYNYDYNGDKRVFPKSAVGYHIFRQGKQHPDFDIIVIPQKGPIKPSSKPLESGAYRAVPF